MSEPGAWVPYTTRTMPDGREYSVPSKPSLYRIGGADNVIKAVKAREALERAMFTLAECDRDIAELDAAYEKIREAWADIKEWLDSD